MDTWTVAGAIAGMVAAMLAFATLAYMVLRDRANEMPAFSADATERQGSVGVYRLNLHIQRLSPAPAWKLETVSIKPARHFRLLRLEDYEGFPKHPEWEQRLVFEKVIGVGTQTPITQGSCYVQARGASRVCTLVLALARATGQRRKLKVPLRL